MRKKIQRYLSGEKEGFSLVELIIVIAIMAILIGVIALAVIPYLNRSRESKDLQALGAISQALSTAVATTQVTGTGTFEFKGTGLTGDSQKVNDEMVKVLGSGTTTLTSTNAKSAKIYCKFDVSNNIIMAYASNDGAKAVLLENNKTGFKEDLSKDAEGTALVVSN